MVQRNQTSSSSKKRVKSTTSASPFSKLDPTLLFAASHTNSEHTHGKIDKSTPDAHAEISKVEIGIYSLADRMSVRAASDYVQRDLVPVLIEGRNCTDIEKKVKSLGGTAIPLTSTKAAVRIPRNKLNALARHASVSYVEASTLLKPTCDLAHESTGLLGDSGFTVSETGRGVLVGVVDTGIDVAHPAFRTNGSTRIVNYLDQDVGHEFTEADINAGRANGSLDVCGHGTHVAGIAAGNGSGSPNKNWRGVAHEADLAIVKTTFDTADIAVAIKHIFSVADSRNQPCVVNLSLGGHFGAHDGSSVVERMIDDLSGDGRVVVVSAGNEGGDAIHASTTLRSQLAPPDRWVADLRINQRTFQTRTGPMNAGLVRVQVWHQREDAVSISLRSPTGSRFQAPPNTKKDFNLGDIFVEASHQQHPYSQDHSTSFFVVTDPKPSLLKGWSIIAEDDQGSGGVKAGRLHAWIMDTAMGHFTNGSVASHLIGMPGTSFSAVTVAAYASRREWPSQAPNEPGGIFRASAMNVSDISYFSSTGPTRDGHNKPEVAGPGQYLLAPLSSNATGTPAYQRVPNRPYAAKQGNKHVSHHTWPVQSHYCWKRMGI